MPLPSSNKEESIPAYQIVSYIVPLSSILTGTSIADGGTSSVSIFPNSLVSLICSNGFKIYLPFSSKAINTRIHPFKKEGPLPPPV